jgi:hypothetical protein
VDDTPPVPLGGQRPQDVVLRVVGGDGLAPRRPAAPPRLTVYADGTLVSTRDDADDRAPELLVRRITPRGLRRVIAAAQAAGLGTPYRAPVMVDAPVITILFRSGATVISTELTSGVREADAHAAQVAAFLKLTRTPQLLVGAAELGPARRVEVHRLAIASAPAVGGTGPVRAWPQLGPGAVPERWQSCAVLSGATAVAVAGVLDTVEITRWRSGTGLWRVMASPLLPDEAGCRPPS